MPSCDFRYFMKRNNFSPTPDKMMTFSPLTHAQWESGKHCHRCGRQRPLQILEGDKMYGYLFCQTCYTPLAKLIEERLDSDIRSVQMASIVISILAIAISIYTLL